MNPHQQFVRKPRSIDLEQLLSQLTPEHRAPVILHYYGDLTYEGVASRLGWGRWRVKRRIAEGLRIMRKFSERDIPRKFFTIGYGGLDPEQLISVLKEHHIEAVVDVRLWPHRASMGSYVLGKSPEKGIQHLLAEGGIHYHSFIELGNPFLQFEDWQGRYRQLLAASGNLLTERLLNISERCCLLCVEKQPAHCHRLAIAEFLIRRGHEVEHLIAPAIKRKTGDSATT